MAAAQAAAAGRHSGTKRTARDALDDEQPAKRQSGQTAAEPGTSAKRPAREELERILKRRRMEARAAGARGAGGCPTEAARASARKREREASPEAEAELHGKSRRIL